MDAFRDSAATLFGLGSAGARRLTLALGMVLSCSALLLAVSATPAAAVVKTVDGNTFGIVPQTPASIAAAPLTSAGGPVMHSSVSYAIYWAPPDPLPGSYHGDWKQLINGYLENVGNDSGGLGNVFAVDTQYGDAGGNAKYQSTFRGAYNDTDAYPATGNCTDGAATSCLTDSQLRSELQSFMSRNNLQGGLGTIYYLLTPPGVAVCTGAGGSGDECSDTASSHTAFCGYHSFIPGTNPTVYVVQPWIAGGNGSGGSFPITPGGGAACQDGSSTIQEPNQTGKLGPDGTYDTGLADLIIGQLSIEQANTVINPELNGWFESSNKNEESDECPRDYLPYLGGATEPSPAQPHTEAGNTANSTIGGHTYFLQDEFDSNALSVDYPAVPCLLGVNLIAHFTNPNVVKAGDIVAFDANESDVDLTAAQYSWSFGDGTTAVTPAGAQLGTNADEESVFHSYAFGGTYPVTLTITDRGQNVSVPFTGEVTVVGPPKPSPPAPAPTPSTSTTGTAGSGSGSGSTSASPGASPLVKAAPGSTPPKAPTSPVATQAVAAQKLTSALKSGLVVRYSVNEQVAGRFEVLLASSIARQLGLHGTSAGGLAKGTPAQTVIAKAVLVTTKGGHSTYKLQFSKTTAARLGRLKKVSLMLRLIVRNASSGTTTVLNKLTLTR